MLLDLAPMTTFLRSVSGKQSLNLIRPTRAPRIMSRPTTTRMASTNLGGSGPRVLEGKLAIVTGGSRGIGAAIATNLASKGASLVINYTSNSSTDKTKQLAEKLSADYGITAHPVQADMGDPSGPSHLIASAKNHFSHPKTSRFQIDIIVNNAGVAWNGNVTETDIAQFNKLYAVNVLGPLLIMKAAEPYLPHDRSGRVVNISSVSSSCGFERQSVYGGTKAALEAMTRTWAREFAERCTVNAVNPGPVATDMWGGVDDAFLAGINPWVKNTPLGALRDEDSEATKKQGEKMGGRPAWDAEIAGVVGMLCAPEAGWSTGSVVCANGGMYFSS